MLHAAGVFAIPRANEILGLLRTVGGREVARNGLLASRTIATSSVEVLARWLVLEALRAIVVVALRGVAMAVVRSVAVRVLLVLDLTWSKGARVSGGRVSVAVGWGRCSLIHLGPRHLASEVVDVSGRSSLPSWLFTLGTMVLDLVGFGATIL